MSNHTAYRGGLSAREAHASLKQALMELRRAEKNAILWFADIMRRRLYRELGYSTIHLYAGEALGFSKSKTSQFIRLAESLEKLPVLKQSVASGQVSWTKAREVARVATPESEKQWVAEAKQCSRRELERKVNQRRIESEQTRRRDPAQLSLAGEMENAVSAPVPVPPVAVTFKLDALQLARFEAVMEKLRKRGCKKSREELLLEAFGSLLGGEAEETRCSETGDLASGDEAQCKGGLGSETEEFTRVNSSSYQVILYKCESCGAAKVLTSRGDLCISPATLARVECDAKVLKSGERNRSAVAPATRRAVLARDGHRCQVAGCGGMRWLEVHHVTPRSHGGSNKAENLITICSACHQLLHEKGILLNREDGSRLMGDMPVP